MENSDILNQMILEDSLSLARPSHRGFSGVWLKPVTNEHRLARWDLPDILLPRETNLFEDMVAGFLSKESIPEIRVFERPEPELTRVVVPPLRAIDKSRLVVEGSLRLRLITKPVVLKSSWQVGSFLKPSYVQIMVDQDGKVVSGVLLESSGHQPADQTAMDIVKRGIVFEKSTNSTLKTGDLVFHWHVDPGSITNILESAP